MSAVPSRASWPAVSAAGGKFSGPLLVPSPIHEHRDGPGLGLVTRPGGVTITAPVSAVPRQVGRLLVPDRGIGLRRTRTPSRGSVGPGPAAPGRRRGSDPGAAIRARSYRRRGLGPTGPGVLRLQVGPLLDRREPPARGAAASASESRPLAAPARARPARASGTPGRPRPRAPRPRPHRGFRAATADETGRPLQVAAPASASPANFEHPHPCLFASGPAPLSLSISRPWPRRAGRGRSGPCPGRGDRAARRPAPPSPSRGRTCQARATPGSRRGVAGPVFQHPYPCPFACGPGSLSQSISGLRDASGRPGFIIAASAAASQQMVRA